MIGIYGIKNKINDKIYIGQSINIKDRFVRHKTLLKHNKHYNAHLQRSYNKHGLESFEFFVLEQCSENDLSNREQHWVDQNVNHVYNAELFIEDRTGIRNAFFGKTHSEEIKAKMSELKKTSYIGSGNPNYGKKQSKAVVLKMVQNNSGTKLSVDAVLEIVQMLKDGMLHRQIADKFNVARTVITRISNGTRWANVTGGPVVPQRR